jgi:hypothetical protein
VKRDLKTGRFNSIHDRGALLGLVKQVVELLPLATAATGPSSSSSSSSSSSAAAAAGLGDDGSDTSPSSSASSSWCSSSMPASPTATAPSAAAAAAAAADPALLSQAGFDLLRSRLAATSIPPARETCRRLGMSWAAVKAAALGERDHDKTLAKVDHDTPVGIGLKTDQQGFDVEDVIWALRLVAGRRGEETPLIPLDYMAERKLLQDGDHRRYIHGGTLLLPTEDQIRIIAGSWDTALELASLPPRAEWRRRRGLNQAEALELCFLETGALATSMEIKAWCRAQGIAYSDRAMTREEALADFRRRLAGRGIEAPASPPPRAERPDYGASLPGGDGGGGGEGDDEDHDHRDRGRDRGERDGAGVGDVDDDRDHHDRDRVADQLRPEQQRMRHFWQDEEIIRATVAFLEQLPAGAKPTVKSYHAWARGHPDRPNVGVFTKAGRRGFPWYLDQARQSRRGAAGSEAGGVLTASRERSIRS